ncbi:MAG: HD domain-containing protein [Planctomycetota bacterium]
MRARCIQDLTVGEVVVDFFLVREKTLSLTRAGKAYLTLDLQDASGRIDAKVWDNAQELNDQFGKGDVVKAQGIVETFQGERQLNVKQLRKARDDDPFDLADLLPHTPRDVAQLWQTIEAFIGSIENEWLAKLLAAFFDDAGFREAFKRSVAARDVHHAYIGGLLEHVVSVAEVCDFFAEHYAADRDLLITGAILHDIGKVEELDSVREFNYTVPGGMLGHIILGIRMVSERIARIEGFPQELALLIEHMVLSHQGLPEWGSPIPPKTREALLLHYADDADSKHWIAANALSRASGTDDPFTAWVRYVGHSFYRGKEATGENAGDETPPAD